MYAVNVYNLTTEGNKQLTKNFQAREFASPDSNVLILNPKLAPYCQKIRDKFGKSWTPSSGYRTVAHNKSVGGEKNSQHLYGNACDIPASRIGVSPKVLYDFCDSLIGSAGGVGIYDWGVHIDVRGYRARWDYRTRK